MAPRSKAPAGYIHLNLTRIPMPRGTASCGKDENGAWYASADATKTESFEITSVERTPSGDLIAANGDKGFVYVSRNHAGIVQIEGEIPIEDAEVPETEDMAEAEAEAEEEAPAPRRRSTAAAGRSGGGNRRRATR